MNFYFFPSLEELEKRKDIVKTPSLKAHKHISFPGFIVLEDLEGWEGLVNYFSGKKAFFLVPLNLFLKRGVLRKALMFFRLCAKRNVNVSIIGDKRLLEFQVYHSLKYLSKDPLFALSMVKKMKERIS